MRNKTIAALIAFVGGYFGLHKFYLGQIGAGILSVLFCWTFIPAIIAFFDCIGLLLMSEQDFNRRFNGYSSPSVNGYSSPSINVSSGLSTESSKDKAVTLGELKKLYDSGVITAEEYEEKRRKLLDAI